MVKTLKIIVLAIFLLLPSNIQAQKRKKHNPCKNALTMSEMRDCASKEYEKADAELNKVYKELMERLESEVAKNNLKESEQIWINFRDSNCKFKSDYEEGGTLPRLEYVICRTDMTKGRSKELLEELKHYK